LTPEASLLKLLWPKNIGINFATLIPEKSITTQGGFVKRIIHKSILLILFILLSMSMQSCSNLKAQKKHNHKKQLDAKAKQSFSPNPSHWQAFYRHDR